MCASALQQCTQSVLITCAMSMCPTQCGGGDAGQPTDGGQPAACAKLQSGNCCALLAGLGDAGPATPQQCMSAVSANSAGVCQSILTMFQAVGLCK
jgi:hypothetical protein